MGQRWQIIAEDFIGYATVCNGLVIQADADLVDLMGMSWGDAGWSGQRVKNRRPRIHHPAIGQHSAI